jgi:adenylosuccinate synthase
MDDPDADAGSAGRTATVVGAQLGDEGKGSAVDLFGDTADVVVRYQGGDNAGHTVVVGDETYELSLTPSGVVRGLTGVLGNGCVVNPATLFDELDGLRERGLDPEVVVAARAHVILPYHRVLDGAEEAAKDDLAAGTTGRGIGPAYEDKAGRRGVRVGDLLDPTVLRDRLEYVLPSKRAVYEDVYGLSVDDLDPAYADAFDVEATFETYRAHGDRLDEEGMTVNAGEYLADRLAAGDDLIFEGAQGTSIDLDHGIYPYVTSSTPTAGGASVGTGLPPKVVGDGEVVGAVKAYLSRVGTGPLPTELDGETAEYLREEGGEYGTVTGRPRRIGWLDLPMLRHAARASGFTGISVSHVDTLAGLDDLRVCVAYDADGDRLRTMPATTERWGRCDPVYRDFEGWPDVDWTDVAASGYDALPENARTYLEFVAEEVDAALYAVGVGPGREETVVVEAPF